MGIHRLTRLSNGASTNDGAYVKFTVETADHPPLAVDMPYEALGDTLQYLAFLVHDAAAKREVVPMAARVGVNVAPLSATGIGLLPGGQGAAILVIRIADFDLGFELPLASLSGLKPSFLQTIDLLASEPKSAQ